MSELRPVVVTALLFYVLFGPLFGWLHGMGWIMPGHDFSVPYHFEPKFARRRAELVTAAPHDIVFTGDSMTEMAVRPSLIRSVRTYTLTCASMTVPMVSAVVVDTLAKLERRPAFLVIGLSPDLISARGCADRQTQELLALYRRAEEFRTDPPLVEGWIERHLPAVFYRDLVQNDVRIRSVWLFNRTPPPRYYDLPLTRAITWPEYFELYSEPVLESGWLKNRPGDCVDGRYHAEQGVRGRLASPYQVDTAALERACRDVRAAGIEPVFLRIPIHESLFALHGRAIPETMRSAIDRVARSLEVTTLEVPLDANDARNFVDGFHLSLPACDAFSRGLDAQLGELQRTDRLKPKRSRDP